MDQIIFLVLSILSVGGALAVVFSRNPVYSVLFLVLTFFSIAGHFVMMNAQFLAIVHIIIYAGAVMVLFLFVIMLLNLNKSSNPEQSFMVKLSGAISGGLLLLALLGAFRGLEETPVEAVMDSEAGLVSNLGRVLFTDFILPFEVSAVLFLSAMIGAVMLGKKNLKEH
ncbi:NADH-quinone oxidoreductase subunit J [Cytophagaceae bacterium ABcell3]|nr:NADH-quinone oxidoreductase subunit J [Cytophagaceae bacterium ABcell3]